jgi:hypothetical protein
MRTQLWVGALLLVAVAVPSALRAATQTGVVKRVDPESGSVWVTLRNGQQLKLEMPRGLANAFAPGDEVDVPVPDDDPPAPERR